MAAVLAVAVVAVLVPVQNYLLGLFTVSQPADPRDDARASLGLHSGLTGSGGASQDQLAIAWISRPNATGRSSMDLPRGDSDPPPVILVGRAR